ncbi:hypothetical protein [Cohnella sp. AR92]|uniref:hypothetical protein n=1 Tax=Cohnella sp. AR92 TaxID=648716 RepID=UPI000F8CEB87|nr:hypothetical protein [Cohnella sp. AR92]RUS44612.1 hypothetical protein ELR57_22785 [Cohnella sp. AR92]
MPRIHRRLSFHEYSPPNPYTARIIGVSVADPSQLIDIAKSKYTEEGYSRLVYSVSKSQLRTYSDEFFVSFIETVPVETRGFSNVCPEAALPCEQPVRCLVFDAFQSPLYVAQEFKYVKETNFLGGIGVYSISSKFGFGDQSQKSILGKVAQYSLESLNLCLRLMVAIVQPDRSWKLALGQIQVHKYTENNSATVRFALFEPADFISSLIVNKNLNEVQHIPFNTLVTLVGDMSYYK